MRILDRLPIADAQMLLDVPRRAVPDETLPDHHKHQHFGQPDWDARSPIFPALLDTGNNHNFSIQQSQITRWAGIQPQYL